MEEKKTYQIPAENLPKLQERIDKLNRRAAKIGCTPVVLDVKEAVRKERRVPVKDAYGNVERDAADKIIYETVVEVLYPVEVHGEAPKYAGWTLVAALQFVAAEGDQEAAMFIRTVPGQTLPETYRRIDQKCDHCGQARRRTETFVVRHEAGTLKQVGRQCIADFLGHQDPEKYAQMAEWLTSCAAVLEDAEEGGWGGGRTSVWLEDYLSFVAMVVREKGWLSRSKARELAEKEEHRQPSADRALTAMNARPTKEQPRPPRPEAEDRELAKQAIEWLRTELAPKTDLNDYQHNLVTICTRDVVLDKGFGVAASLIPTYKREMGFVAERKIRRENDLKSQHFGAVGERAIFTLTLLKKVDIEGEFGLSQLNRFVDANGNIATWFASGGSGLEIGKTYTLKGTVKRHEDYKGIKQTLLTRCSVEDQWRCPERLCQRWNMPDTTDPIEVCPCGVKKGSWVCPACRKVVAPDVKACACGHDLKSWSCNKCHAYNVKKAKTCANKVHVPTSTGWEEAVCGTPKNAWICRDYACGKWNDPKVDLCSCGRTKSGFLINQSGT